MQKKKRKKREEGPLKHQVGVVPLQALVAALQRFRPGVHHLLPLLAVVA